MWRGEGGGGRQRREGGKGRQRENEEENSRVITV